MYDEHRGSMAPNNQIANLTQHVPTPEQEKEGVEDFYWEESIRDLLSFNDVPSKEEIEHAAFALAELAWNYGYKRALIGGAPYLMGPLELALRKRGTTPLYAFSKRESVETTGPDGKVIKKTVFKHLGLIEGVLKYEHDSEVAERYLSR